MLFVDLWVNLLLIFHLIEIQASLELKHPKKVKKIIEAGLLIGIATLRYMYSTVLDKRTPLINVLFA